MSPEIGHRRRRNPAGWSRIFVFMFFATVYYAAIIDITAVPGQSSSNNATVGVNVAKFLDFNRADVVRQVEPSCVETAISDLYGSQPNYTAGLLINTRDSRRVEVVQAAASAPNHVQVQAILGPETSIEADCMIPLREKAQVPITSFSESSPTVVSIGSPYFFRATHFESTQVINATAKSARRQQSIPTDVDNAFGQCIVPSSVDTLDAVDPYRIAIFQSSYEVVNVHGNGARVAGFWTPCVQPAKELMNYSTSLTSSTSRESLWKVMIWQEDRAMPPRGFEIPTSGKKLRIGVPVKSGFSEFVSVTTDPVTNKTSVTGYSIDVFEAVVLALPYALPFEYVPFAGTYDELVYQIFLGNFDAVVGDVTIIADRSMYVDFSLPYTESGVSMVVTAKPNGSKNPWLFLKPLTWNVWVTVFFLFLFIGFVVWVFEHRMLSKDFRGPPSHEVGTGIWFSFSAMVFAQRENAASNLVRTVVIIWCFVMLIMTMSYTASFTSLQTMQGLQPTSAADMNELLRKGEFVGYQDGSFVRELLKQLGFRDDRLVPYHNIDHCDSLFGQGKIAAAFDEVPYMKLFLARHYSKYRMINPTYKTGGFGFVFPKGSPLVPDISRAVLNVAEGDTMAKIEEARIGKKRRWLEEYSTSVSSENQLGLESFWCLFLIAGVVATVSALCIVAAVSIYKHRKLPVPEEDDSQSNPSFWRRILNPFTICYKINPTCHTSRDDIVGTEVHLANMNAMTPSTFSVRMDFSMDSPQSPTPLIESLWIQPTNLLR